jgi:tetratricopeptide (TPR) repeat protein
MRERASRMMSCAGVVMIAALAACGSSGPPRLSAAPLDASWASPQRPRLPFPADTNSADAYENWGRAMIAYAPDSAAAAFFWASRLDPWRASPYYERGIALLLTHAERPNVGALVLPWAMNKQLSAAELSLVDSLNELAMLRDPYMERSLDSFLSGTPPRSIVNRMNDPAQRGFWEFAIGAYDSAVVHLGKALVKKPDLAGMRTVRAVAFYYLNQFDSTAAELEMVLSRLEVRERKQTVLFYRSKAMVQYALGIALVRKDDPRAREHFEAALVEDLSFYMARVRLAGLALQRVDTAAAIASLAQAVELKNDDAALQYFDGVVLRDRDRAAAAAALQRAVELAPEFAPPHMQLAALAELRADTASAIASYERFIALSPSTEPDRLAAMARRQALTRPAAPR